MGKNIFKKYTLKIWTKSNEAIYLLPPFYEYWADPFIFFKNDKIYIFFEGYNYFSRKGHIKVGEFDEQHKKLKNIKTLINEKFHMSYPSIFEDDNKIYLIPETFEANNVYLYQFVEFPTKVKIKTILLSNKTRVDSTIYKNENGYFLFTNKRSNCDKQIFDYLEIYHCKDLIGEYKKIEVLNIEKNDASNARMAGNILKINNNIFRISQNGTRFYGENLNINKIEKISNEQYKERYIGKFDLGITNHHHTYNELMGYKIIDEIKYIGIRFVLFIIFYVLPAALIRKILRKR